ncbi:hypothetical protein [Streptomyces sp. NPDC059446]|uniref:hypothetical protein n=1 Tax=Streptomyces sp. NPDC059446 TaxID=3346833 RepID=UPI00368AE304
MPRAVRRVRTDHGALGPGRALVSPAGRAVLRGIEGLMHLAEWEHVFLRLRLRLLFGWHGEALSRPGSAPGHLALHFLATHLSLAAGLLRPPGRGLPDREFMRSIDEHRLVEVPALLP